MRRFTALAAAAALAAGPVAAQAQAPAPLAATVRAGASVDGANEIRGGFILPVLALVAIIALLAVTDTWPFDEPSSP